MNPCSTLITSLILIGGGALFGILSQISIQAWINYTRKLRNAESSKH